MANASLDRFLALPVAFSRVAFDRCSATGSRLYLSVAIPRSGAICAYLFGADRTAPGAPARADILSTRVRVEPRTLDPDRKPG